jgi:hypothetical protein
MFAVGPITGVNSFMSKIRMINSSYRTLKGSVFESMSLND